MILQSTISWPTRPPASFNFGDDKAIWVARLVGLPGDILEMKEGRLYSNGKLYPHQNLKHSYTVDTNMQLNKRKYEGFEYLESQPGKYVFHATREQISELKKNKAVDKITSNIMAPGVHEPTMFLNNRDNWGPIRVLRKGMRLPANTHNKEYYESTLKVHEGFEAEQSDTSFYMVQKDYYFLLGDNRHNALDSRYFGLIPYSSLVGVMQVD